jgi:hypothetical protein
VRRKKGSVLADLAHPGDEVLVARGGQGGVSCLMLSCIVVLDIKLRECEFQEMHTALSEHLNNYAKSREFCFSTLTIRC